MDITEVLRFVGALVFIIGLIGLCGYAARKWGLFTGGYTMPGALKRLAIVETKPLDTKNRLVLIRRDGKEHLILLGAEQSLVIESGIDAPVEERKVEAPANDADTNDKREPETATQTANERFVAQLPVPAQQMHRLVSRLKERRA
ncbi:flagellar protein FliO/FliZ [Parvibaculum indicum]|uniref:FliO/MopB family protein n=1 Tax=Parvibaculum indicum TaxID=562969 RepID=UPI00141E6932|nr:flagellar biosynthetic protein FliO [Parvibaculum indicum]NIJ41158.1 flagellar protein FliO/FliZ [Parvibaculum indicum]